VKRNILARATFTALISCALVAAPVAANATEQIPTTYDERVARGCEPELAETGVNDSAWLFAGGGLLLLVAGASLVTYRKRQKGASDGEQ